MKRIPLQAIERQSLSVLLDGSLYDLAIKEASGVMAVDIVRDGVTLVTGRRATAGDVLIPARYMEEGNFFFLTQNDDIPYYTDFGGTTSLMYLTVEEMAAIRSTTFTVDNAGTVLSSPIADFNYANNMLPYGLTNARSTEGHYQLNGKLYLSAANAPRFETNGLLIEQAATNLMWASNDFSDSTWSGGSITRQTGFADPQGGTQAVKYIPTTAVAGHGSNQTKTNPLADGLRAKYSVYAKAAGYHNVRLRAADSVGYRGDVVANLETGQITAGNTTAELEQLADGWWRISSTFTLAEGSTYLILGAWVYDNDGNTTYAGDGVSGALFWGGQVEIVDDLTSLITTGATSTASRAADSLVLSQEGAKTVYRELMYKDGTLVKEFVAPPLLPVNFKGWVRRMVVWNRELSDAEKKAYV